MNDGRADPNGCGRELACRPIVAASPAHNGSKNRARQRIRPMTKIIAAILTLLVLCATTDVFAQRTAVRERCHIGGNADGSGGMWCDCIDGMRP